MKKTKLLTLTALTLIGLLGLSSCGEKGEKGDTGATGPAGETGPKGDKGDPGENGEDGKDGATWLTGTSKPADTLGNLGDMYLNTTNGDVYQKEESGWTLKMNIKGEDGEDGEDGANGSNGSTGPKGETAWSNTILPTTGGRIGVNVGSALEGDEITFTFTPDTDKTLTEVTLNGNKVTDIDAPSANGEYSYTTTMVKNGFVVSAKFDDASTSGTTSYFKEGTLYTGGKVDVFGNVIEEGTAYTGEDSPKFSSGDGLSPETALVVNDVNNIDSLASKLLADTGAKYFELAKGLSTDEKSVVIEANTVNSLFKATEGEEKEVFLNLGGNNVDLPNRGDAYAVSNGANVEISNGKIDNSLRTTNTTTADISVDSGSKLTLNKVELVSKGGLMAWGDAAVLNIVNSTIESSIFGFGTNASDNGQNVSINIVGSKISSNTEDGDNTGLYVNIPSTVYIEDSVISGDRQGMFVRQGDVTLKDVTIEYGENINEFNGLVTSNNRYLNGNWGRGNEIPSAALVLGDRSNVANYQEVDSTVTIEGLTIKSRGEASSQSLLVEGEEETPTTTPTYYLYCYNENTASNKSFTLNIDKESYDAIPDEKKFNKGVNINVTGVEVTSTNTFVDGQLYSSLYLKDDGSVDETLSTKVDGVKFASGIGTENDPLIAENAEQLECISNIDFESDLYVKLVSGNRYEIDSKVSVNEKVNLNLDLNGATITPIDSMKSSQNEDIEEGKLKYLIDIYGSLTINDSTKTEENPAGTGYLLGGRGVIQCLANSSLTVNSGTLTDISRSGGSAIYCDPTATLVINYVEIYCSNFAVGAETSKVTINGGKFVSISNNTILSETGATTFSYCVTVGDGSHLVAGEVIGIQGGTSCTNGSATIEEGWNSKTSAEEAKKIYQEVIDKTNQTHPYSEEEKNKIDESKCFYGLYVAGETTDGPTVIVKGGNYYSSYRSAVLIGNSNDGGEGTLANCRIEGGTYITGNDKETAIRVDQGKDENNYGKGNAEIIGGYFLKTDETKKWLEANISEGYVMKETTLEDGTPVYQVVLSE